MDKPIRVAQIIGMATNGGVESIIMNYYRHIDRTKVQFDFLVESESKIINKEDFCVLLLNLLFFIAILLILHSDRTY